MDDSFRSSSPIANLIQTWASKNHAKVAAAINFKGGWEGWAQVEIAYEMVQAYSSPMASDQHRQGMKFDVTREAKVYANKPDDRVDLVIHMPGDAQRADARPAYLFELKCESNGGDATTALKTFKQAVKKDSAKFDAATGINPEYLIGNRATLYSIAICVTDKGDEWMRNSGYNYTRNPTKQDGSDLIGVWWKKRDFGP